MQVILDMQNMLIVAILYSPNDTGPSKHCC